MLTIDDNIQDGVVVNLATAFDDSCMLALGHPNLFLRPIRILHEWILYTCQASLDLIYKCGGVPLWCIPLRQIPVVQGSPVDS